MPADKIVLGLAAYGRSFGGVTESKVGTPASSNGPKQRCTQEPGLVAYSEIVELLKSGQIKPDWDENAHVPYAFDEKAGVFYSYDDVKSWNQKLDFIEDKGLGGAMIWEIDQDDFKHGNPLISAAFKRLEKK